ncbi:hypothetical protein DLB95_06745 [Salmonella enterica subsp. diarizonae]|uniref:Uncharacterized protein n=1 Tax=Salmonella diarizonae TaxID=59204 RepID=A0A5Y3W002_SALDZ|nr:hypothetical protein [Salmonella enterica subsp. diarizonae]ECJ4376996.1 hypothetical protein [Salmonella enterica subsp. diarizonae]
MTVRVTFEFTHTKDGIDVKSDVVPVAEGCCACEMAFASITIAEVTESASRINQALKADVGFAGTAPGGCVH